jgi:hypothetical protein
MYQFWKRMLVNDCNGIGMSEQQLLLGKHGRLAYREAQRWVWKV